MFFKEKVVAVIGSDDHAAAGAAHLAQNSSMVHVINPKPHLECKPYWLDDIKDNPKVKIYNNANLLQILGDDGKVLRILIEQSGERQLIDLDGVFIEMGSVPSVAVLSELNLKKDKDGYIVVDEEQRTSEKGIYAAGDLTTGSAKFMQIITAAAEGAVASFTIFKDLRKDRPEEK
jgi:thioredoxin reductase